MKRTETEAITAIEARGPDALRFLNGQVTQDVSLATMERSVLALVTDAKGKLQAELAIHHLSEDAFLLTAPAELADTLYDRLDRYLISDDLVLEKRPEFSHLTHVLTDDAPVLPGLAKPIARYGEVGLDLIGKEADFVALAEPEPEFFTKVRVEHRIPAWGRELTPGILPQEANTEASHISFNKGCYIGQEVISRIKSVGRVNRMLTAFSIDDEGNWENAELLDGNEMVAQITSATSEAGLAFLHRKFAEKEEFEINGTDGCKSFARPRSL